MTLLDVWHIFKTLWNPPPPALWWRLWFLGAIAAVVALVMPGDQWGLFVFNVVLNAGLVVWAVKAIRSRE